MEKQRHEGKKTNAIEVEARESRGKTDSTQDGGERKSREEMMGVKVTVHRRVGRWEVWPEGKRRRREDKAREDLLRADNEGVIRSEIAYRRFANSGPHRRPYSTVVQETVHAHTHTGKENGQKKELEHHTEDNRR